jgi:tetratricopeptide (TPR) repeat protein
LSAEKFWKRFVTKSPESADAWAELGFIYWIIRENGNRGGLSASALEAFTKAVKLGYEDDGLVWDRIGHLYQEADMWSDAEAAYRRAVQMNPKQFGYCYGVSLIALEKYDEALPLVLAAARHHQPDALSWGQVALCYLNLNQIDAAIDAYNTAIKLDPNDPIVRFNLGGIYWNKKDVANAAAIWKVAIEKFPDHDLCKKAKELIECGERRGSDMK